jgi:Flp pilus assembly protein TadB
LLRLLEDIKNARLEEVAVEAFQEAGFGVTQVQSSETSESLAKQRTKTVLIYSYSILSLSVLLTVIGVTAALWHMAWWISVAFVLVTLVSPGVVVGAMASWPSRFKPRSS